MSDLGASFSFPFRSPLWLRRVLFGAVLELIPLPLALPFFLGVFGRYHRPQAPAFVLLGVAAMVALLCRFVVLGYLRRTALGVLNGTGEGGLPAWDRPADDLVKGLKLWLVGVVLWLPAIAVTVGVMLLLMALVSPHVAWIPVVLLGPPAALVTLAYLPAGLLATIAEGDPFAAFDFERVVRRVAPVFGPYAIAFLVAIAAEILAQLGLVVCCVGIFVTRFIAHCVAVHAFAAAFRQGAVPQPAPAAEPAA